MRATWIDPAPIETISPLLHPHPLIHELLVRRGLRTPDAAREFLTDRPRHAPDPSHLPNVQAAVERIGLAIQRNERIGVFGDYDADGVTATAVMTHALRAATARADAVIARLPTRDEGYGLNLSALKEFQRAGVGLLIAVDCGSGDQQGVDAARALGMDVVALDHHQIEGAGAEGATVVSAQLPGGEAYRDLCSAGLTFLVVAELAREGFRIDGDSGDPETELLDLVALGTIADMVPVNGINRALVRDGIRAIRQARRPGIAELCRKAGVSLEGLNAEHLVFKLGPRLNAAGRMGDPRLALELLLETDRLRAAQLANQLEALNDQRRQEAARVTREAELAAMADTAIHDRSVIVVDGQGWHTGVLGIVAASLTERFGRPAVVLSTRNGTSSGSARSVTGFDVTAALGACAGLLSRYGGHGQAAGLSLPSERIGALRDGLEAAMDATGIPVPAPAQIRIDADVQPGDLTMATAEALDVLQPFGIGNEQPILRLRDARVRQWEAIGSDKRHLRLQIGTPSGMVRAVAFGMAERSREFLHGNVDLAFVLKIDHWNGQRRLDAEVKDFRAAQ